MHFLGTQNKMQAQMQSQKLQKRFVCEHANFTCMFGKKYNTLTHMVKVKTTTNTNLQVHVVFIVLLWHMSPSPLPPARVEVVETLEQQS